MTFNELLQAKYRFPTVALFKQPHCHACELLLPRVEAWCKDRSVRLEVFNIGENLQAAKDLNLRMAPSVAVVHNGKAVLAFAGNPKSFGETLHDLGVTQ